MIADYITSNQLSLKTAECGHQATYNSLKLQLSLYAATSLMGLFQLALPAQFLEAYQGFTPERIYTILWRCL
jgi:hypothetical protein